MGITLAMTIKCTSFKSNLSYFTFIILNIFNFFSNKPQESIKDGLIEVDIIRQDNLAYEYLCHLEETKVYVFIFI